MTGHEEYLKGFGDALEAALEHLGFGDGSGAALALLDAAWASVRSAHPGWGWPTAPETETIFDSVLREKFGGVHPRDLP